MKKSIPQLLLFLLIVFSVNAQGSESFENIPPSSNSSVLRTWTGDNGLTWTAGTARTDGPTSGSTITGFTGRYIIVRNTTGIITCDNIPNGCGTLSFNYAKAFTSTSNIPTMAVFVNGVQFGTSITVSSNAAQSYSMPINVAGNFKIEIRQLTANDNGRLGVDNINWTSATLLPPCPEPSAQPTALTLTPTPNSVSGSFTTVIAPTTIQNYLVVRTTSSTLNALPVDGTTYAIGSTVNGGNGIVVAISDDGNFVDNSVVPSTQYYYFVFSMEDQNCSSAPNYLQASPLENSTTTPALPPCSTPAAAPTSLVLTPANTTISGSFTASASANSYLTIISANNTLSATPVDGTSYSNGTSFGGGTVIGYQNATSFVATGLTTATTYHLFVFAANNQCTGAPFYLTTSLTGTATTTNNTTGIPAGYYDPAIGLSGQPLKTALKNITNNGANTLTYTPGIWNLYQFSDIRRNDANTADIIYDMYSDNPTGPEPYTFTYGVNQDAGQNASSEGQFYNREHSTPQSFFGTSSPMVSDAHHIFPTDKVVNALRSNFPYGEVVTATNTTLNGSKLGTGTNFGYSGTVFEPIDEYKGDFARAGLYMATRYEDQIIANNWSANGNANALFLSPTDETDPAKRRLNIYDAWQLSTLIKWHNQDPVSQKEIDRNNVIYYQAVNTGSGNVAQNNRNPFVDRPEFVDSIYKSSIVLPVTLVNFEGQQLNENVLLKWSAASEISFKQYEIERSFEGNNYLKVGTVAGQNLSNYQFTDYSVNANSIVYYRLKMIDIDGRFNYSNVVAIRLEQSANSIQVFPNPTNGNTKLRYAAPLQAATIITVYDFTGRLVKQVNAPVGTNITNLNLTGLSAGKYAIKIANSKQVITKSVVIAN